MSESNSKPKDGFSKTRDAIQDIILVVTLVQTLKESFGSVSSLYQKLKRKSHHVKDDIKGHIKEDIKEHLAEHQHNHHRKHRRSKSTGSSPSDDERGRRHRPHFGGRSHSQRRRDDSSDSDRDFINNSAPLILAEYEQGYRSLGEKYAAGDLITRNLLQSQIISLQQALLHIYIDILESPQHPPSFHLHQLLDTTRAARAAAIDALAAQHKRMLPLIPPPALDQEVHILPVPPGSFPISPPDHGPEHHHKPRHRPLFCRYALEIQSMRSLPLHDNFRPGGSSRCPACHAHIAVSPKRAWEIIKQDELSRGVERRFLLGSRFVVKCHREGGGYACILCREYRDADTVCGELRSFMDHIWREHTCAELVADENIVIEVGG